MLRSMPCTMCHVPNISQLMHAQITTHDATPCYMIPHCYSCYTMLHNTMMTTTTITVTRMRRMMIPKTRTRTAAKTFTR